MKIQKQTLVIGLLLFWVGTGILFAQQRQVITGNVTELLSNGQKEPLIGCNINVLNKDNRSVGGTVTDISGAYMLSIPSGEQNLAIEFSFIGMKTQKITYTGQQTINIALEAADQTIGQIDITARRIVRNDMGISHRENVSASQKIEMDELVATSPVLSVEEALQGRLSGVDIVIGSGDPGARSSIRIRGTSTLTSSAEPLIVIDGVPYNTTISEEFDFSTANNDDLGALLNIAPTDIAEVEILKDAAATAIWGTKGSNGVLLITTKRGTPGKTSFSFSSKFSTQQEPRTIPMLNGNQYVSLMQEALWNAANYEGFLTTTALSGLFDTKSIGYDPNWEYFDEYNQNTDWLDEIRRTSFSWDNNFSMSGGGDKAIYRFSLGYLNNEGITIGTGLNRLTTSLVVNYNFSNKLTVGADFAYSQSDVEDSYAGSGNLRSEAFRKMPNKSPYYIDNDTDERTSTYFTFSEQMLQSAYYLAGVDDLFVLKDVKNYNPNAMAYESFSNSKVRDTRITFRLDYKILPGFTYKGWASINMKTNKNRKFLPAEATGSILTAANISTDSYNDDLSLQFENKLMYIKSWEDKHQLIATAVLRNMQAEGSNYSSQTVGHVSSSLSDPAVTGSQVRGMGSGRSEARSISGVGVLNYMFLSRYVLSTSLTAEGNSAMGKGRRWGLFPMIGFSYNMHYEPFLRDLTWLEELKLRFATAQSGNAPKGSSIYLGAFQAYDPYMTMSAVRPIRMQLNDLRWETSDEINLGADVGFFGGKLRFNAEYYQKHTKDLLQENVRIPSTTGYGAVRYINSGELSNKGWEFRADIVAYEDRDWRVSTYVNFSRNINEVIKMPQTMTDSVLKFENGEYQTIVTEGRPIGSFYGLRYEGVYQNKNATYARDASGAIMNDINGNPIITQILGNKGAVVVLPGDAKYEDINHDGVIDQYDIVYLGSCIPIIMGGAGFSVRYKQLTLSTFFHGRLGQKVINSVRMQNEAMYNGNNQSTATLRRWRREGDDTDIPRALFNVGYNYMGSDRFVEDASYVRLKTLTLTYNVPRKTCQIIGFNSINIFATGYDLFTFTNYTGQNPEISPPTKANALSKDGANTPVPMRFACGVNLSF